MPQLIRTICLAAAFAVNLGVTGCMLGPDYARPQTPAYGTEAFFNTPAGWFDPNNPKGTGPWWQNFGDPVTAELVRMALENNYDLKAAAARVAESEALLRQVHGGRLPQVSYALDRSRSKNTFFLLGGTPMQRAGGLCGPALLGKHPPGPGTHPHSTGRANTHTDRHSTATAQYRSRKHQESQRNSPDCPAPV